jgi:hypothetical protein
MNETSRLLAVRIALTVTALEFFGPIARDFAPSHALNPTWVGHARVHLVWLLGFIATSADSGSRTSCFRYTTGRSPCPAST